MEQALIKPPVEVRYKEELEALRATDTGRRPENWQMSPRAVRTFILGSAKPVVHQGKEYHIEKKYFGNDALVERCIVTLAGNRGLMLVGEPGTAKTMLSELLSDSGMSVESVVSVEAGSCAVICREGGRVDGAAEQGQSRMVLRWQRCWHRSAGCGTTACRCATAYCTCRILSIPRTHTAIPIWGCGRS